ncbi:XrtA system polysaccharide chain length determinant [Rhodocyclus tenuis]|uniref:Polysaccharide chain length determinant protein (PEP-CTERM system associated) n=1 Tax=Rhodocyclus tenuis TaxID=1066 RepID=A0A840GHC8_RHOTE|nr:XrtA system polysaccharide chain length determinant [Rhodocyclus tenuis]MBB4247892.1 polysaccharide chain length determinant protein (PEP-CTERM system associated) [Rhodocyclus tenuis]MBK1679276.1 chain length-determining protein [Rhodocyclus tenuis]
MEDILRQALAILRAAWKHRHLGVLVAWVVGAIAAGVILRIPDRYEASARIFVDTQSILKPLLSGLTVQPNVEQQVMMLSRTLISRPNVEKLVRMADLDLNIKSKAAQEALIDELTSTLKIQSVGRDNLYTLSYRDTDPAKAQRVVQALVSIFVESSLGDKREDSDSARKFIEEQIRGYEKKLADAENRLKEFKLRNIELQTGEGKSSIDRLSELTTELNRSRLALREAEQSRDALRRQIAGEEPVLLPESPGADAGVSLPEIDGRIDTQKRNLDNLLQRYTEKHPDVLGTRRLIKDLEEQKRQELLARKKFAAANPGSSVSNNPVYQQLKVSLAESEASVASLQARVAEYESRYKRTTTMMRTQPEVEAEFSQLNRDYEIDKRNYEQLVSRRESAELSGNLDSAGSIADFRLIDPPRASNKPASPNRLLLLPGGLLAALAAGMFAAFVASQLRPVFFDGKSLRDATGLPLLGTVWLIPNETRRLKERASIRRFLLAVVGLIAAYGVGIAALSLLTQQAA